MLDRELKSKQTLRKSTKTVGYLEFKQSLFFQTEYVTSLIFLNVFYSQHGLIMLMLVPNNMLELVP